MVGSISLKCLEVDLIISVILKKSLLYTNNETAVQKDPFKKTHRIMYFICIILGLTNWMIRTSLSNILKRQLLYR